MDRCLITERGRPAGNQESFSMISKSPHGFSCPERNNCTSAPNQRDAWYLPQKRIYRKSNESTDPDRAETWQGAKPAFDHLRWDRYPNLGTCLGATSFTTKSRHCKGQDFQGFWAVPCFQGKTVYSIILIPESVRAGCFSRSQGVSGHPTATRIRMPTSNPGDVVSLDRTLAPISSP